MTSSNLQSPNYETDLPKPESNVRDRIAMIARVYGSSPAELTRARLIEQQRMEEWRAKHDKN